MLRAATKTQEQKTETLLDVSAPPSSGGGTQGGCGGEAATPQGLGDGWATLIYGTRETSRRRLHVRLPGVCAWACNAKRQNRWNAGADTDSTKAGQAAHIFAYVHACTTSVGMYQAQKTVTLSAHQ